MKDIFGYSQAISRLRYFFQNVKGFVEVPAQSRKSILAACEDPSTITCYEQTGVRYPLPQTGQMWLEAELLKNPGLPGIFCITTSYRDEPNPIEGRHERIFPMFEFESHGDMNAMRQLEAELLEYLGFGRPEYRGYEAMCQVYGCNTIEAEQEGKMCEAFGNVISLEYFPERSNPYWNMKYAGDGLYNKIDVLLHSMETIGSAERETDKAGMRDRFYTQSNGGYAGKLFELFGRERVEVELEEYLKLPMFDRFGGGIGMTRMVRAMRLEGLIEEPMSVESLQNMQEDVAA